MHRYSSQPAFQSGRSKKDRKTEFSQHLARAVELHQSGLFSDAQAIYRQLVKLSPKHFDALYLLGLCEYHAKSFEQAEVSLTRAVKAEPSAAKAHLHRGIVLFELKRFEDARLSHQRALALQPGDALTLNNLANACWRTGRFDDAIKYYGEAIVAQPDFVYAWSNRGLLLSQAHRFEEALQSLDQALTIDPRHFDALVERGNVLLATGRELDALESYRLALEIRPRCALTHNIVGNALFSLGRFIDARNSYNSAVEINPQFVEALNGSGAASFHLRQLDEAVASYSRAIALKPDYAEAFNNRATVMLAARRFPEALADYDSALAIAPRMSEALVGRGSVLQETGRAAEAIASCEQALEINPNLARALCVLGQSYVVFGRIEDALAKFDEALAITPNAEDLIAVKIFAADFDPTADFAAHRDVRSIWWERIGMPIAQSKQRTHSNERDPERRLVVGYVSSDFRNHSMAFVVEPVLRYSDKTQFDVICYSCSTSEDPITEVFRGLADKWHNASQWSDDRLARQIKDDHVDILVDLSGHTAGNRLRVFAEKPAPIQVHGWGQVMPPGLSTIDYVFADPIVIPTSVRHLFKEEIYDLPCILTLDPLPPDVARTELPSLGSGATTFGVFNRITKISDAAVALWVKILQRVPGSKLLIKHSALDEADLREKLLARFVSNGASPDQIEMLGSTSRSEHLSALNRVDISLDPFPVNGGVSTWESLQMGVPVVALLGNCTSARAACAISTAVGLQDWVAETEEDYVEIAVGAASDRDKLGRVRRDLPNRVAGSVAGNPEAYAAEVGKGYRSMWRAYCAKDARLVSAKNDHYKDSAAG